MKKYVYVLWCPSIQFGAERSAGRECAEVCCESRESARAIERLGLRFWVFKAFPRFRLISEIRGVRGSISTLFGWFWLALTFVANRGSGKIHL